LAESIAKRNALIDLIAQTMCTRVFGSLSHPSQWDFPWDNEAAQKVLSRNATNTMAQKCDKGLDDILEIAFSDTFDENNNPGT
jgi:hypothetical protein